MLAPLQVFRSSIVAPLPHCFAAGAHTAPRQRFGFLWQSSAHRSKSEMNHAPQILQRTMWGQPPSAVRPGEARQLPEAPQEQGGRVELDQLPFLILDVAAIINWARARLGRSRLQPCHHDRRRTRASTLRVWLATARLRGPHGKRAPPDNRQRSCRPPW